MSPGAWTKKWRPSRHVCPHTCIFIHRTQVWSDNKSYISCPWGTQQLKHSSKLDQINRTCDVVAGTYDNTKNIRWQPFLFTVHSPYWTRMTCWHSSSFDTSFYSASTRLVPISTTMKSLLFIQRSELLVFNMADSSFISVGSLLHAAAARWAWRWQWFTATRV